LKAGGRLAALFFLAGCGTAPPPRQRPAVVPSPAPEAPPPDPCAAVAGKPPPEPLTKEYAGVLKRARCQAEVLSIMNGVAKALGVGCEHCHDEVDYAKTTPKKEVANWMARELVPRLAKRGGGDTTCADCHADDGKGKAKILGAPRSRQRAVEWMTVRLVERFDAAAGGPLYCASCHVQRLGDPGFDPHVIFTEHLPPRPVPAATVPPATGAAAAPASMPLPAEGTRDDER
jgi:hypothetical protein